MQTTELIKAIQGKDIDRAKVLIANGADVNEVDGLGWSALCEASYKGYINLVKLIVDHGADINADHYGWTALYSASAEGHIDIVKFLMEHGAMVNATSTNIPDEYKTAPILFFTAGYSDITRLLLEHGASINGRDEVGSTVLISALNAECQDTAYVLLEHISEMTDINAKTDEGLTALMYAEMHGYSDIVNLLREAGAGYGKDDLNSALINTAGMTGRLDIIKFLLKKGADVNARDENGNTALIEAALIDQIGIVEYLIELGADVHIKNNHGKTALEIAQDYYWHTGVIELLKKAGAKA